MNATTTTTVQVALKSGQKVTLTTEDCAAVLNALARRRLLSINIEAIPAQYEEIWTEECCAIPNESESGDAEVVLSVNASDFVSATERKKPRKKR